jgi:hypothetical protein
MFSYQYKQPDRKRCSKCGQEKEVEQFSLSGDNKRRADCKACASISNKERYQRKKEQQEKEAFSGVLEQTKEKKLTKEQREQNNQLLNKHGYRWIRKTSSRGHPFTLLTPQGKEITEEEALHIIATTQTRSKIHVPRIGDHVLFVLAPSHYRPALIVGTPDAYKVNMIVFFDREDDRRAFGRISRRKFAYIQWMSEVPYSEKKEPGSWHYRTE